MQRAERGCAADDWVAAEGGWAFECGSGKLACTTTEGGGEVRNGLDACLMVVVVGDEMRAEVSGRRCLQLVRVRLAAAEGEEGLLVL